MINSNLKNNIKGLRIILILSYIVLAIIFCIILVAYCIKFSGCISNKVDDWNLFISICNLGFSALLTGLNVWVFYKLTLLLANNESKQFVENKISRTENALMELRISDYKELRQEATNLKLAVYSKEDFKRELNVFMKTLYSMYSSLLFDRTYSNGYVLDSVLEYLKDVSANDDIQDDILIEQIDRSLKTIEVIIFSTQLRDDRIGKALRKNPNRFDPVFTTIDNLISTTE